MLAVGFAPTAAAQSTTARQAAAEQLFNEAFQLAKSGNHAAARNKYEMGLQILPGSATGHYYYAETLQALGQGDQAFREYQQAARLGPDSKEGVIAGAIVARESNRRAAEAAQRQAAAAAVQHQRDTDELFASMRLRLEGHWCNDAHPRSMYRIEFASNNVANAIVDLFVHHGLFDQTVRNLGTTPLSSGRIDGGTYVATAQNREYRLTPTATGLEIDDTAYHRCSSDGD